ncbi:hypothetical protein JHK87_019842 [Glycine soja]|nr:hypothetical protein JHK87_019842 [Glycine soja]
MLSPGPVDSGSSMAPLSVCVPINLVLANESKGPPLNVNVTREEEATVTDENAMPQSPPTTPTTTHSPLLFAPQVPVVPLQRPDDIHVPSCSWMETTSGYEDMYTQILIFLLHQNAPAEIREGLCLNEVLPSGVYQYRFIVDGRKNPEDIGSISSFEPPQSPDSSYDNLHLSSEDYAKEPPLVPPLLQMTLLNVPATNMEIQPPMSRPRHGVLNHLYTQKGKSSPSVAGLGTTHRFLAKYVTVVDFVVGLRDGRNEENKASKYAFLINGVSYNPGTPSYFRFTSILLSLELDSTSLLSMALFLQRP